jgi:hypothetical protein
MELAYERRKARLSPKNTHCIFVDITLDGSILSNPLTGADQATKFTPSRDGSFETRKPVRIRRVTDIDIICDANSFQSTSDEI